MWYKTRAEKVTWLKRLWCQYSTIHFGGLFADFRGTIRQNTVRVHGYNYISNCSKFYILKKKGLLRLIFRVYSNFVVNTKKFAETFQPVYKWPRCNFFFLAKKSGLKIRSSVFWANRSFLQKNERMRDSLKKRAIRSFTHFWWATWAIPSHRWVLVSDLSDSLTSLIKKQGMSQSQIF